MYDDPASLDFDLVHPVLQAVEPDLTPEWLLGRPREGPVVVDGGAPHVNQRRRQVKLPETGQAPIPGEQSRSQAHVSTGDHGPRWPRMC